MSHLSKYNLDIKNAGQTEGFRLSLTCQAISVYDNMLTKPNLFRTRNVIKEFSRNRLGKADWFRKSVKTDVILNIPPTQNQTINHTYATRVRP